MTYDLTGRVAAVDSLPLGGTLELAALAGATELFLVDTADFGEDGGTVLVGGTELLAYVSCDDAAGVLVLAEPLAAGWDEDTRVELWDVTANGLVVETIAQVLVEGMEQSGDSLTAIVDHALIPFLPECLRDPDPETGLIGEAVSLAYRGDDLFVVNILGQAPVFNGELIDPETLPGGGATPEVPDEPAAPTVFGGIGTLMIRWEGIVHPNPVVYEVHASATPGFTPSADTHVGDITGTALTVRRLPTPDVEAGTPDSALQYDTVYYVALIAKDSVDESYASALSVEGQGSPVQATDGDLAADSVTTTQLTAQAVQAENLAAEIVLASSIKTAEAGQRVELDTGGMRFHYPDDSVGINLPTAEGEDPSFRGRIQADGLTVREGATFYSPLNEFARGSVISLAEQVAGPVAGPIPTTAWDFTELSTTERTAGLGTFALDPSQVKSITYSPSSNRIYILQHRNGGTRVWYYRPDGSHFDCWDSVDGQRYSSFAVGTDGEFRLFYKYSNVWWFRWFTGNNTYVTNRYNPINPNKDPFMFMDGDDIYIAETSTSNQLIIRRVTTNGDLATLSVANTTSTTGPQKSNSPCMAYRGSADFGGTSPRWVVSYPDAGTYRVYSGGGTYDDTLNWDPPVSKVGGFWNSNTQRFYTLGANGRLYEHSSLTWTDPALDTWHVGQSFFKDGTSLQTAIGTVTSFQMKKRARVIFTVAEVPYSGEAEDPDAWRMFGKRGTAPLPDRSDMHAMAVGWYYNTTYPTSAAPPLTGDIPLMFGTFPGATPARLKSGRTFPSNPAKSVFQVNGDGSGWWGPLEFNALGQNALDTGWLNCTLKNGWGVVEPVQARFDGHQVWLRGRVSGGTSQDLGSLPPEMPRPSSFTRFVCYNHESDTKRSLTIRPDGDLQGSGGAQVQYSFYGSYLP